MQVVSHGLISSRMLELTVSSSIILMNHKEEQEMVQIYKLKSESHLLQYHHYLGISGLVGTSQFIMPMKETIWH